MRRDEPFEVQPAANRAMAAVLRRAGAAALVLSAAAVLLPGAVGQVLSWATFGLVVAVPLGRVGWLGVRWVGRRDLAFAALAFGLLLVVGAGGAVALLIR